MGFQATTLSPMRGGDVPERAATLHELAEILYIATEHALRPGQPYVRWKFLRADYRRIFLDMAEAAAVIYP